MSKDFDQWNILKRKLNADNTVPYFKEREIWWASIGTNIGHEQDGKNAEFSRPVLVVKKFNKRLFWAVPLTTQIKDNPHYHPFKFKNGTLYPQTRKTSNSKGYNGRIISPILKEI